MLSTPNFISKGRGHGFNISGKIKKSIFIRQNKRTEVIDEIINTKANKKILISDIKQLFKKYILIDYNDTIFKAGKENTLYRKKLLQEFQDEYLLYPKNQ